MDSVICASALPVPLLRSKAARIWFAEPLDRIPLPELHAIAEGAADHRAAGPVPVLLFLRALPLRFGPLQQLLRRTIQKLADGQGDDQHGGVCNERIQVHDDPRPERL